MAKSYLYILSLLYLLTFSSCQSLEVISIDYMKPADLTFLPQFKKVAVVNNTTNTPDKDLTSEIEQSKRKDTEVKHTVAYANGDAKIATEAMAEEIANQNYFDEVIICDSALRANDHFARESTLSKEEIRKLTSDLQVDCLIAIEKLQIKASKKTSFINGYGYEVNVNVKMAPTIKIYLADGEKLMAKITPKDSIFWEEYGSSITEVTNYMPSNKQILEESAEYAGIFPVKQLLPYWTTAERFLYKNGSVGMRDAIIYVRENSWDKAYELWDKEYKSTKSKKKKMRLSLNIALYHEINENLPLAEEWTTKAQQLAKEVERIDEWQKQSMKNISDIPNFYKISLYLAELEERNKSLPRLKAQMQRFKE